MKAILASLLLFPACLAVAQQADKYQVTGPIVELTDKKIVVEGRGKERHEFARPADLKVSGGELKVGTKVTVKYSMVASSVEVKDK